MSERVRKTVREIVEETAAFYTSENRAVRAGGLYGDATCQYLTEDRRMCAVGRCLIDPSKINNYPVDDINQLEELLKPEYRGHPIDFWGNLQSFHDTPANWNDEGLSTEGKSVKVYILEDWA